jgi:hypothetical protein
MNTRLALMAVSCLALQNNALAEVDQALERYGGWQQRATQYASAGLRTTGITTAFSMSVAAGFTITCEGSFGSIDWQDTASGSGWGRWTKVLEVPIDPPGNYAVPKFFEWAPGVPHTCEYKYRGIAKEGSYQLSGGGFTISLGFGQGGLESNKVGTVYFDMIRDEDRTVDCRQCCIP